MVKIGKIKIEEKNLVFLFEKIEQDENHFSLKKFTLFHNKLIEKEWKIYNIERIQKRRFLMQKNALEIFFFDGSSILFTFPENNSE